jgi:hypothetical protein
MDDLEALIEGARQAIADSLVLQNVNLERIIRSAVYDAMTDHLERHHLERLT